MAFALPACAMEVIQAQSEEDLIKQNTRKYNAEVNKEVSNDGIYIPNPIDYIKSKKGNGEAPPPKEKSSLTIDCDKMEYKEGESEVVATGHVIIMSSPDKIKLTSDKAVFNNEENYIKLYDNIKLYKDGGIITGDYMVVDLSKENILMNEPVGTFNTFKITAREGYAYANKLEAVNGDMELAEKMEMRIETSGFGSFFPKDIINEEAASFELRKKRSEPYRIKTKEIIVKNGKNHDEIIMKNADVYYKKFKLISASELSVLTDKERSYAEINIPELGSINGFGVYVGAGPVLKTPGNSTLKVMPAFVYKKQAGIGAIIRHRSKRNELEAGWATSSKNLVLRGRYHLNDDLYVDYGRHAYIDEWINWQTRPGYIGQLVHMKSWDNNDLKAKFTQRVSGGYVADYAEKNEVQKHMLGTMRLNYQAELSKRIFNIENKEQEMYLRGGLSGQVSASMYGTGDFTGFVRAFPTLESRIKGWGSRVYAGMAGIHGRSPLLFDNYRYGKVYIGIEENIRLCKYLTLGYRGIISPLKDNIEKKLMTENRFYAMVGPEDFKLALSYDSVRETASFDVVFLFGSDNSKIHFNKAIIEDPAQSEEKNNWFDEWKLRKIKVPKDETI